MEYIDSQRPIWHKYECTIMCDGRTRPTCLSIVNFMVYTFAKTIFFKFVDMSYKMNNLDFIFKLLFEVKNNFGNHNIIQIVTDNGSTYKKAGHSW